MSIQTQIEANIDLEIGTTRAIFTKSTSYYFIWPINRLSFLVDITIMSTQKDNHNRFLISTAFCAFICLILSGTIYAQGSIFGQVVNDDLTNPSNGDISFLGFIDNSDDEIRIESSIGAGYDSNHWYDDFQNFLGESADLPYQYYFTNLSNGQSQTLSKFIPNNSFQQEDIMLEVSERPDAPLWVSASCVANSQKVFLSWTYQPGLTYHLYRRLATTDGSFFRIDDPTGSLSNPGLSDSTFIDPAIDCDAIFQYILIAEDEQGRFSQHSDTISAVVTSFVCGDANGDDRTNVGDAVFLINYVFKSGPAPSSLTASDANCDGRVNVGDAVYMINFIFKSGLAPCALCN